MTSCSSATGRVPDRSTARHCCHHLCLFQLCGDSLLPSTQLISTSSLCCFSKFSLLKQLPLIPEYTLCIHLGYPSKQEAASAKYLGIPVEELNPAEQKPALL